MAEMRTLVDVARELGVTADQLRYWVKLAGVDAPRHGRERMLSAAAVDTLGAMAALVAEGVTPGEAARRVGGVASVVADFASVSTPAPSQAPAPAVRIEQLERAIMALVEAHRQATEKARADVTLLLEAQRLADEKHRERVEQLEARIARLTAAHAREAEARQADAERAHRDTLELKQQAAWTRAELTRFSRHDHAPAVPVALLEAPKPVQAWQPQNPRGPRLEGWRRWVAHFIDPTVLRRRCD